ncbi:MAG: hypothetical protein IJB85_08275 [Clostridia bacterium]|nr:hypothetical protein [Clostridia bacterium]
MSKKFNKKMLAAFIQRKKMNALGLTVITAASAVITLICAFIGFKHTDVLVMVTVAMVLLCLIQYIRTRRGFRTLHAFKGSIKKRK